jgi:PAS domain S-box-containing protein
MTANHDVAPRAVAPVDPVLHGEVAFRLLVDAVEDYAIFLLSADGHVLTWNRGAERTKGYLAEEIIGQHFSVFYTADERASGRPMKLLGLAAERGRFEDEGWRVRKDGTRFWADVIITALTDEAGTPYAYAKITRDLTERRASEEHQRQLLAEQRARAAAEEALIARDRFLSIASHELKTPVASLGLSAESLLRARDSGRLDEERLATGLDRILTASLRLDELVRELLDISRLTSGQLRYDLAPTDLVALAREVVARFAAVDEYDRIRLVAPGSAVVEADGSRIDQVLTNLVDNALKYSNTPTEIEVAIVESPDAVELRVSDRGMGLDETASDRLFEAFNRAASAEHVPGLGLGLHIASQIVSRHGGRIQATPRADGPGAVFSVTLPRRQGAAA